MRRTGSPATERLTCACQCVTGAGAGHGVPIGMIGPPLHAARSSPSAIRWIQLLETARLGGLTLLWSSLIANAVAAFAWAPAFGQAPAHVLLGTNLDDVIALPAAA